MTTSRVLWLEAGCETSSGADEAAWEVDPGLRALASIIDGEPASKELLPAGTMVCLARVHDRPEPLFPEEARIAGRFVAKRRREFLTGRACARRAMVALGRPAQAIDTRPDGGPRWPDGLVGSISHTDDFCIAVVGTNARLSSIGVDLELVKAMSPLTAALVLTETELQRFGTDDHAAAVFAMKEAFLKAYYPLAGGLVDFRDVEICLHPGEQTWSARLVDSRAPGLPGGAKLTGSLRRLPGHVLAIAAVA